MASHRCTPTCCGSRSHAEGEHVVHVGTGTGYYTAIMAHLVGAQLGTSPASSSNPDLAARARGIPDRHTPNAEIVEGDGTAVPFEPADVIYVNAGATRPADIWLDRLKDGGRLVLPLTTDDGFSSMLGRGMPPARRRVPHHPQRRVSSLAR